MTIIDCVSDLHGYFPKLEGGDLLIVAGDLTARDELEQYIEFNEWISAQEYKRKIIIAGNHDGYCEIGIPVETLPGQTDICIPVLADKAVYLQDSGTEFEGLKIWGSPWTAQFPGINPKCCAFTVNYGCDTDDWLDEYWEKIPNDIDILITHGPPFGILDMTTDGRQVGSCSLMAHHMKRFRPKLWVFGHIHESYGQQGPYKWSGTKYVNASHVNERYEPVNKPIRIEL